MSGEILTATLSCDGSEPGTLGHRTLTFVPTVREFVEIGRSSKREAKNLTPACDNAWFDSRVMSRHHARLWVSFENKALYICDGGSMHGTWVNDVKIMPDQDVELHNDDALTFGNDVTRGAETFPPLKVTCQYGFHTSYVQLNFPACMRQLLTKTYRASMPEIMHSINTFIVPDVDENDIVQVTDSAPGIEKDGMSDDSDMGHSTPITSPSNKEAPLEVESKGVKTLLEVIENPDSSNGTSRSPILLDNEEPLVTPRMTPPSVLNTLGEPQGKTADGVQGQHDAQPSVADYMNDIEVDYSDDDDDDDDEDEEDDQDIEDEDDLEAASDDLGLDDEKVEQPLIHEVHLSSTTADEKKDQESCKPRILESIMPFSRPESTTTRLPSLFSLSSNGWNDQQFYPVEHSQYSHVPPVHGCAPTSETPQQSSHQEPSNVPATADREHKTRVSIADILDTQTAAQGVAGPSKRKASEMLSEDKDVDSTGIYTFDANPTPVEVDTSKETYSQDAQPQPSLSQFNSSTQATDMNIIEEAAPSFSATKEERPSKRVKVDDAPQAGRGRGFVSHTATAIAGALVGSVGTVALLASLPPDFFA